jgi:hypothetical protein
MAKSSSPSCSAWKSVATTVTAEEDAGDILKPLKRVRDKYIAKVAELEEKAYGDNRAKILELAASYQRMADSVGRIIGVIDAATFVEVAAPVDQTERILSDVSETAGEHENTQA